MACSSAAAQAPGRCTIAARRSAAAPGRRRTDALLAVAVLALEVLLCLTLWGPQPLAWLWVGSQVDYHADSVTLGIAVAFAGMIATLMLTLAIAARLDRAWRVLRRAAGYEQREGMLVRIFAIDRGRRRACLPRSGS